MRIALMKEVFEIAHKSNAAVKMIGRHGIGKSKVPEEFAKENGFHFEVLQLPLMDEGDLMGNPITEETEFGKVTTWAMPVWLQRVAQKTKEGIPSIIFLDELGRANPGIRQVALQMVLEHRLQEHSLGVVDGLPSLMIVADNPSDEYDTADADPALESRFMSFNVEAHIDDFLKFAAKAGMLPVVTDYLAEYTENLHFRSDDDTDKGTDPRAWEKISDILKNTPKNSPLLLSIILSKLGQTVGNHFFHYFKNYIDIVKPEDIVALLEGVEIKTEKQQRAAAKKLSKTTKKIEVGVAQELANKMLREFLKGSDTITAELIAVYSFSLNLELMAGIFRTWKDSKEESESDFYFNELQEATPNRWLLLETIKDA